MKYKKYICSVCGYVYDEEKGLKEKNIPPATKWADIPDDFVCPLCNAAKDAFEEQKLRPSSDKESQINKDLDFDKPNREKLSYGELSVICSNYAKGLIKQYLPEQAALFDDLAKYFDKKSKTEKGVFSDILSLADKDINQYIPQAKPQTQNDGDRGGLRALVWSEKVTKMLSSLIKQYQKSKDA
ncbi:MAG: rubredoxin, partial [Bacillota bacterium]